MRYSKNIPRVLFFNKGQTAKKCSIFICATVNPMTWSFKSAGQTGKTGHAIVCGHRGAPVLEPENTMVGFQAAADHGATWVEFDVRPAGSGDLVIHHDPHTADGVDIGTTAFGDLDESIPRFEELATGLPALGLDIEMKTDGIGISLGAFAELVIDQIARHVLDPTNLVITSFDADALAEVRSRSPELPTGLLYWQGTDEAAIERAVADGHKAIAPSIRLLTESTMSKAAAASLAVLTWTVNDPADVVRAASLGVDMIIGDDPRVIAANL